MCRRVITGYEERRPDQDPARRRKPTSAKIEVQSAAPIKKNEKSTQVALSACRW